MYNVCCFITFCYQSAGKFQKYAISVVMMVIYDIKSITNWTDKIIKKVLSDLENCFMSLKYSLSQSAHFC